MKFIDSSELNALQSSINNRVVGDILYDSRVELYSCE